MRQLLKILVCALLLTSCGPANQGLQLDFSVLDQSLITRGLPAPEGEAPSGIDAFRLCVQLPDGVVHACREFTKLGKKTYRIGELPVGPRRVISFQGFLQRDKRARWCGRATEVNISKDKTTKVQMLLTHCGDLTDTAGEPQSPRVFHTASRYDSLVYLAGGFDHASDQNHCPYPCISLQATQTVEAYKMSNSRFEALGTLTHARGLHAARVLADGRILVAGGCQVAALQSEFSDIDRPGSPLRCLQPGQAATTAELFDPQTGLSTTIVNIPPVMMAGSVAVSGDELLIIGGQDDQGIALKRVLSIKVHDDQINVNQYEEILHTARRGALTVRYSPVTGDTAEIMLIGGNEAPGINQPGLFIEQLVYHKGSIDSQLPIFFDQLPQGDEFPVMHAAGCRTTQGRILVSGGLYPSRFESQDVPFEPKPLKKSVIINVASDAPEPLQDLLSPKAFHTATRVNRLGDVVILGGFRERKPDLPMRYQASADLEWWQEQQYRETTGYYFSQRWVDGASVQMASARAGHTATLLPDGTVLIVGGTDGTKINANSELFNPAPTTVETNGLAPL